MTHADVRCHPRAPSPGGVAVAFSPRGHGRRRSGHGDVAAVTRTEHSPIRTGPDPGTFAYGAVQGRRSRLAPIGGLIGGCFHWLSRRWPSPRWHETTDERVIVQHGRVEIHQLPARWVVRTCVKGELNRARETGLRRLTKYLSGENLAGARLDATRPMELRQLAPDRWQISVGLPTVDDILTAPVPCTPKVTVVALEAELLAAIRMSGRPDREAVSHGDALILNAFADTDWVAIGAPAIRMNAYGPTLWFGHRFQVAVPVSARHPSGAVPPPRRSGL
jgi:hypothetical protein